MWKWDTGDGTGAREKGVKAAGNKKPVKGFEISELVLDYDNAAEDETLLVVQCWAGVGEPPTHFKDLTEPGVPLPCDGTCDDQPKAPPLYLDFKTKNPELCWVLVYELGKYDKSGKKWEQWYMKSWDVPTEDEGDDHHLLSVPKYPPLSEG